VACTGCATGLTGNPRSVAGTQAQLFGAIVSTTGNDVEYWVQYGPTTAYGSESTHSTWPFALQPNEPQTVLVEIGGLQRDTTYHYRFCAQDSQQQGGPGCGEDKSFTTPNVDCGDVITHDLTLSASLQCDTSPDLGLVVGADGVDINLNGHAVSGASGRPPRETSGTGIDNGAGRDDVTIRNGAVVQWSNAVHLDGASFNLIRNVNMSGGNSSVRIDGGESNTIRSSVMTGTLFAGGLGASDTDGLVVADSSGDQWAISGDGARVVRNQINAGTQFFSCLWVSGNRNRIADNRVFGCGQGSLVINAGSDNEVIGNEVSDAFVYSDSEIADGIHVGAFTARTLLQDNFAHDNDDDGIDVRASSARLQGNQADDNGDFGIDAVAGVTDLGGNTASGNGNPLQCRNVFCAASP
jgi:parallel beta-helix repeat protein